MRSLDALAVPILLTALASCAGVGVSREPELVIASGGNTDAVILVSPAAGEKSAERAAAADLAKYMELMTGARPEIADTPEGIEQALAAERPVLIVGQQALTLKPELSARLAEAAKENPVLRSDAIVLLREGNRVYLAGNNDSSHYYAVSELLHRWGCRWFVPTEFGECIPAHEHLSLGELAYTYGPPFEVRTYWISWNGDNAGYREFALRNRMTGRDVVVPSGHALGHYVKDLVPEGGTTFNIPISEERTARHVAAKIEPRFAAGENISLGMDDGLYESDSPRDKELLSLQWDKYFLRPSVTDAFMELYNNVCRILLEKHPDSRSRIGFLAYSNMTIPPVRPIKAARPLVAYLAPIDIDPIHGMDDADSPQRTEYRDMLYGWAKVMDGRVVIYDYDQGMMVWRDIPNPSHQSFRQDVKHYRRAGILGVDTESRNAIATTFINLYLRGRLMWNPDADVEALLTEFYPKFYGPAADPMRDYWSAVFEVWERTIVTEHEHFIIPAIYTPELVGLLKRKLEEAESLIEPLKTKRQPTRNEKLYVQRMAFSRMCFDILEAYTRMVRAAATEVDYASAVEAGERGLAVREKLTDMNGTFTTYRRIGEHGPAWWPGEVEQYGQLLKLTDGTQGRLVMKLPLEWAFRRDPSDAGLKRGWHTKPVDLTYWNANKHKLDVYNRKDYPDEWEMVRSDLYIQAQGVRRPDRRGCTGYGWYRVNIELTEHQTRERLHLHFPGLFNECWLCVNGIEVAHREMKNPLWWRNDYRFEWDVDLTGKLRPGANTLALRIYNPHHFGGMFRRPFLYSPE